MKLRQSKGRGQLRLLRAADMPKPSLEKELVDAIRAVARKMGIDTWSGRIWVRNHTPPFLPALGPGTPDILAAYSSGKVVGIECKRTASDELRQSQALWKARYPQIACCCVSSVAEAVEFLKANRG